MFVCLGCTPPAHFQRTRHGIYTSLPPQSLAGVDRPSPGHLRPDRGPGRAGRRPRPAGPPPPPPRRPPPPPPRRPPPPRPPSPTPPSPSTAPPPAAPSTGS